MKAALKVLRENPDVDLVIEGHTSSPATDAYNMALGERRAKTVFDYFIKNKIDKSRLSTVSFGESRPKDPSDTEAARTHEPPRDADREVESSGV